MNKQLLKLLEELWKKYPEERFGQLLFNYTRFGTRAGHGKIADCFHYQDKDIIKDLKKILEENEIS